MPGTDRVAASDGLAAPARIVLVRMSVRPMARKRLSRRTQCTESQRVVEHSTHSEDSRRSSAAEAAKDTGEAAAGSTIAAVGAAAPPVMLPPATAPLGCDGARRTRLTSAPSVPETEAPRAASSAPMGIGQERGTDVELRYVAVCDSSHFNFDDDSSRPRQDETPGMLRPVKYSHTIAHMRTSAAQTLSSSRPSGMYRVAWLHKVMPHVRNSYMHTILHVV